MGDRWVWKVERSVDYRDGRSEVLPYPGYEVYYVIHSILFDIDVQRVVDNPHPGGWLEAPLLMAN